MICTGVNGYQNASRLGSNLNLKRYVSTVENGEIKDQPYVTIARTWRASDGALKEATTDVESTVLVLSNDELGAGDDEAIATGNVKTGFDADNLWMLALMMLVLIASGTGCVIVTDKRMK